MECSYREGIQQDTEGQVPLGNRHGRTRVPFLTLTPTLRKKCVYLCALAHINGFIWTEVIES